MTNNKQYIILLKLAQMQFGDKQTAIDKNTGEILVQNEDGTFSPIQIDDSGIKALPVSNNWTMEYKNNLLFIDDFLGQKLAQNSFNTALQLNKNSQKTDEKLNVNSPQTTPELKTNSPITQNNFDYNSLLIDIKELIKSEPILNKDKKITIEQLKQVRFEYNIRPIAPQKISEFDILEKTTELLNQIYLLVYIALSSTKQSNSIAEILGLYKKSANDSKTLQIKALQGRKKRLIAIINKVNAMKKGKRVGEEQNKLAFAKKARRLKIIAASLVGMFAMTLVFAMINSAWTGDPLPSSVMQRPNTTIILVDSALIQTTISQYEIINDTSITTWRKEMILTELTGMEVTEDKFILKLDSLIKYGWK